VLICDIVEAAARSKDREFEDENELRDFIFEVVWEKLDDGQFDEAPISVKQVRAVIERLVPIMRGALHRRIPIDAQPVEAER